HPALDSLDKLKGIDGLQYKLPPNSLTEMCKLPIFRTN
ncbi:MAG: hypothetical protein AVDCRST_MAG96-2708, partial [uncultured Segetibacter sp.]